MISDGSLEMCVGTKSNIHVDKSEYRQERWAVWISARGPVHRRHKCVPWPCSLFTQRSISFQPRAFADAVPPAWTCSSLPSHPTIFLLTPTYPQFCFLEKTDVPLQDDPGPPTTHLLFAALANFNHYLCLHDSLIQFCSIDLSLLTFPIHLINFSFSRGKRRK